MSAPARLQFVLEMIRIAAHVPPGDHEGLGIMKTYHLPSKRIRHALVIVTKDESLDGDGKFDVTPVALLPEGDELFRELLPPHPEVKDAFMGDNNAVVYPPKGASHGH